MTDWFYKAITAVYFIQNRTHLYVSSLIHNILISSILPAVLKNPISKRLHNNLGRGTVDGYKDDCRYEFHIGEKREDCEKGGSLQNQECC